MMRARTRITASALGLALVFAASSALASPCTLLAVDKADGAKLRVYFTKFVKEDNTGGKYKSCRVVKKAEADTLTFFVTPFRQDATDVVHPSSWPQ